MENRIPIPTDSIYKFYALFGLLLFVFCIGGTIYVARSTNELIFNSMVEYETLNAIKNPNPGEIAKRTGIEKRVAITVADKEFFLKAQGLLGGIGLIMMIYGFRKWHSEIQPIQDETARLQLEKLRYEVRKITSDPHGPQRQLPRVAVPPKRSASKQTNEGRPT